MKSQELKELKEHVGRKMLVLYEDFNRACTAFGTLEKIGADAIHLKTHVNIVIVPSSQILKIKIKNSELGEVSRGDRV